MKSSVKINMTEINDLKYTVSPIFIFLWNWSSNLFRHTFLIIDNIYYLPVVSDTYTIIAVVKKLRLDYVGTRLKYARMRNVEFDKTGKRNELKMCLDMQCKIW